FSAIFNNMQKVPKNPGMPVQIMVRIVLHLQIHRLFLCKLEEKAVVADCFKKYLLDYLKFIFPISKFCFHWDRTTTRHICITFYISCIIIENNRNNSKFLFVRKLIFLYKYNDFPSICNFAINK